jgi:hypothetical protein
MRLYKSQNPITKVWTTKENCYVYEILLNVKKELQWSQKNFLEYEQQGFSKELINVNNDGYLIKNDIQNN